MAAALAKLCDVHELVLLSRRCVQPTKARTWLGRPGTLSSRLQPNHPTDDPRGITLLCYWGLSMGCGDALIGLNPSIDTVEHVAAMLRLLDRIRRRTGVPTQTCVLAHIRTQLACLQRGEPVEVLFQSLAGTEATNVREFDITIELLDEGFRQMAARGALRDEARQFMYFETGQGSEYTYGRHHGIDMATTEALCYGLARRYDPFMVNNVTGFIGPETHSDSMEMILSNLQDQFMGKLMGLPMGMAPCYTLHSDIQLEGQQMATELLTAAGAVYYMDVALNTDRMLAYFDTSGHDDQTLREIHGREPAGEFLEWCLQHGIFTRDATGSVVRGPRWGDPLAFSESAEELDELRRATPALYGFESAGPRPANDVTRNLRLHQAIGREAIQAELDMDLLLRLADFREVRTKASTKREHLNSPDLGAHLAAESRGLLTPEGMDMQLLVSDGLSAEAVHHNLPDLLPALLDGIHARGWKSGRPIATRYGRVKLAEPVAQALDARLVVYLIGERPGGDALAARSLSAYLVLRLNPHELRSDNSMAPFEYTVVSNIGAQGLPAVEAASLLVERIAQILHWHAAGNRLEGLLKR